MDKKSVDWKGPMPALVTPFDAKGAIDEAAYRRNVDICISNGMTGFVPNGCTGEFWAQSMAERKKVMKICVDAAKGRAPVIPGCGAIRTEDVIELASYAKEIGAAGVMILPPYFVKPSMDDVFAHYKAVSDAVKIPIMLYNIPANAGYGLTPEMVSRLADLDTVVAIKESSGDFNNFYRTMALAGDRIHVMLGPIALYGVAAMSMGAPGFVDTVPNFWAQGSLEMYESVKKGDMVRAMQLQRIASEIRILITANGRNMYCSTKAIMNMLGLPGGYVRPPLKPLGEPHLTELRTAVERLGIGKVRSAAAE